MSGSSLDGVDLAWCTFRFSTEQPGQLEEWQLHRGITVPYPSQWQERLRAAPELSGRELWRLHTELGLYFGEMLQNFLADIAVPVDFIASHGHTVFHYPDQQTTTQIGDGAAIAGVLGLPVIDQFRSQDMAVGGQGAPLAPLADQYLFAEYFAALNLGGIANLSIKTPRGYLACDTGGANQVLDVLAQEIGLPYDDNGQLARSGRIISALQAAADALPFYQQRPPKSLGNDWVREQLLPIFQQATHPLADRLHTYCQHVARQVGQTLRQFADQEKIVLATDHRMLVTGGGAFNGFLCEAIAAAVHPVRLVIAPPEVAAYKEAALMALAGALRWQGLPNVLPSATGARRPVVGGAIHWGK